MKTTVELAREAGGDDWDLFKDFMPEIERLVALVRADEREIVMNEPLTKENWQRFEDGIRADEREKAKHNEEVLMNALWKACGDDAQVVEATIESQGELK